MEVQQQVIDIISHIASTSSKFSKKCVVLCLLGITQRVADKKTRAQAMKCLTTFCEAVGPGFIFKRDAQDLGISIELLPLSRTDGDFNISTFYAGLLGLDGNDLAGFKALAGERFEDMKDQLRKRMVRKRKV